MTKGGVLSGILYGCASATERERVLGPFDGFLSCTTNWGWVGLDEFGCLGSVKEGKSYMI